MVSFQLTIQIHTCKTILIITGLQIKTLISQVNRLQKLSQEVKHAISSKDVEAARNYFERFADMATMIFRRNTSEEVIKTLQTFVDKIAANKTTDKTLLNKYIEILYKGTLPECWNR